MNERIKELKKQATDFYLLDETLDCSITELHELVEQKFAELLLHDVLSQNILQAQRVDKDPVCQNYPKEVIAGFFYADMLKRYGVEL